MDVKIHANTKKKQDQDFHNYRLDEIEQNLCYLVGRYITMTLYKNINTLSQDEIISFFSFLSLRMKIFQDTVILYDEFGDHLSLDFIVIFNYISIFVRIIIMN